MPGDKKGPHSKFECTVLSSILRNSLYKQRLKGVQVSAQPKVVVFFFTFKKKLISITVQYISSNVFYK